MLAPTKVLFRVLSPKIASKAMQAFDRATVVVVGASWAAALLMMLFAIYTVTLSVSTKRAADAAAATEPSLPTIVHTTVNARVVQGLVDRLQHRFPDLKFEVRNNQNLSITTLDGSKFRQWLSALSYVDTVLPEYHWSLLEFCVGKCGANELMRAVLSGEKITFEAPQLGTKN